MSIHLFIILNTSFELYCVHVRFIYSHLSRIIGIYNHLAKPSHQEEFPLLFPPFISLPDFTYTYTKELIAPGPVCILPARPPGAHFSIMKHSYFKNFNSRKIRRNGIVTFLCVGLFAALLYGLCLFYPGNREQREFRTLTKELFREEMAENTLNLHYTLAAPASMGIADYQVTLPGYSRENTLASLEELHNLSHTLADFSSQRLSGEEAYTLQLLQYSVAQSQTLGELYLYEEPLSPGSGMQSQLPILLAEYTFRSERDVTDYLELLAQTGDYFVSLLAFEEEKAAAGLLMARSSLEKVIDQCDTILTASAITEREHFLQTTFSERLQPLLEKGLLSREKAEHYAILNDQLLRTVLLPAYQTLGDGLFLLKEQTASSTAGLSSLPLGHHYYEALLASSTGSSRSIAEIKELLLTQFEAECDILRSLAQESTQESASDFGQNGNVSQTETFSSIQNQSTSQAVNSSSSDLGSSLENIFQNASPQQMLADLQGQMASDFPAFPGTEALPRAEVKAVSACLEPYCAPAFYLTAPLDDSSSNAIYINESDAPTALELYTTLAHEGYPGHLYQTVYHNRRIMAQILPGKGKVPVGGNVPSESNVPVGGNVPSGSNVSGGSLPDTSYPFLARELLSFPGYQEGWAVYVEFIAYDYAADLARASDSPALAVEIQQEKHSRSLQLCLYSVIDLLIHSENASKERIGKLLANVGITNPASLDAIYDYIAEEPANYLKYYLGYLEFCSLKEQAKALWGATYSDLNFHTFILDCGPSPFGLLQEALSRTKAAVS